MPLPEPKLLFFGGGAKDELRELPQGVRREFGHALWLIQQGATPANASPFEGSHGGNIMKLTERYETDTYRAVYAAKFEHAVFVLHVFMKKSTHGISTPRRVIEVVQKRYRDASARYARTFGEG